MGSFRHMFATDTAAERDGVWIRYGMGMELRCARAGGENKLFERTLERAAKPYRRALDADALPPEDIRNLLIEVFSQAIVREWKGVTMDDLEGNGDMTEVPFSVEACQKLFKALPDIFNDVREAVSKASLYRAHLEKADTGN